MRLQISHIPSIFWPIFVDMQGQQTNQHRRVLESAKDLLYCMSKISYMANHNRTIKITLVFTSHQTISLASIYYSHQITPINQNKPHHKPNNKSLKLSESSRLISVACLKEASNRYYKYGKTDT